MEIAGRRFESLSEADRDDLLDAARDYRGDVTIVTADGTELTGFLYDHDGAGAEARVKLLLPDGGKEAVSVDHVSGIGFSERDPSGGKSLENWQRRFEKTRQAVVGESD
ncbi:MAG: hypothetical protein AAF533_06545 [Acidobacteriota bacterium]